MKAVSVVLLCGLLFPVLCRGSDPSRQQVAFATQTNAGAGHSMYVVGSHRDLGAWSPTNAVRMSVSGGTNWYVSVGVQSGVELEYKFIRRTNDSQTHCVPENVEWTSGSNLAYSVPAGHVPPYQGKTVYYYSSWTNAMILWSTNRVDFQDTEMEPYGAGRFAGETLYRAAGFAEAGADLEFVPHGFTDLGVEEYDNAPYPDYGSGNYFTPLDVFYLQDGQVYNYQPPAVYQPSRVETVFVNSAYAPTIPSRNIRIYLPRNYDQNTWKRYPVLYMHDGQNVFQPGGAFGSWAADFAADKEIGQGRIREAVIVGVDNTSERLVEYIPAGDDAGFGAGTGDQYADFLIHNVRPTLDFNYRTLNDYDNTMVAGSSLGGLISAYLGFETNVFGRIGAVSPSFWAAPNFVNRIDSNSVKGVKVYMDMGTDESEGSMWTPAWEVYGLLQADGFTVHDDLEMVVGCGHGHNEPAWSNRMDRIAGYLLNIRDEANRLALSEAPVSFSGMGSGTLEWQTMRGAGYVLEETSDLVSGSWSNAVQVGVETSYWGTMQAVFGPNSASTRTVRVKSVP